MDRRGLRGILATAVLAAVCAVQVLAQLLAPGGGLAAVTQALLMPSLALFLLSGPAGARTVLASRTGRWVTAALLASWAGDSLPRLVADGTGFLVMVGCFLLAQLSYIAAFLPFRGAGVLGLRPGGRRLLALAPYPLVALGVILLCAEGAGSLILPVVLYAAALATMAMLSTGLGVLGGIGGAVFLVSDALIALEAFAAVDLPHQEAWVMLTYITGQVLLVVAVRSILWRSLLRRPGRSAPGGSPRSSTRENWTASTRPSTAGGPRPPQGSEPPPRRGR